MALDSPVAPVASLNPSEREIFNKVEILYKMGTHRNLSAACNEALVRCYVRRCANRPTSVSKRVAQQSRRLEAAAKSATAA